MYNLRFPGNTGFSILEAVIQSRSPDGHLEIKMVAIGTVLLKVCVWEGDFSVPAV